MVSGVVRILLQGGARARGARVPKFVVTKSSRSESHLALGLQNLRAFANSRGNTCPSAPVPDDATAGGYRTRPKNLTISVQGKQIQRSVTFMASVSVLTMMRAKMPYSKPRDVTSHQMRYCSRAFGMYRRSGLALSANSIQLRCSQTLNL